MHTEINVRNVHDALPEALRLLKVRGVKRASRNGPVTQFVGPVTTTFAAPTERVMFHPDRDCNPFFHLYESLWMLAGRRDVKSVAHYVKRMAEYSDDGKVFHGAYGYRWRHHFGIDQINKVISTLANNPEDRRCVIGMWDPRTDLGFEGKDFPCNTTVMFSVNWLGNVDMTVTNRSNDIIWGAYGANAVHFSMLQEYIASALQRKCGCYYQQSNNLHAYESTHAGCAHLSNEIAEDNPYRRGLVEPFPIMSSGQANFDLDLSVYMRKGPIVGFTTDFFRQVVTPMHYAHEAFKAGGVERFDRAKENLENCRATDWKKAALEWIERRERKANAQR